MKYLFILFLFGCGVSAQKVDNQDIEFETLMKRINANNEKSVKVQASASKVEKQLVTKAVATITQMKSEISELKNEISEFSEMKKDTIYIHDTILIKEKKNFWGKVKTDTTN